MSPRIREGIYCGAILLLALSLYSLTLRLRLSAAREQNEALVKERDALQALLAEQDADGALQKRLQEQLRKSANDRLAKEKEQLEARQRAELQEVRQEHEKQLAALRTEHQRIIKEIMARSVPGGRFVDGAPLPGGIIPGSGVPFPVPAGVANVALGKPVTTSVDKLYAGNLAQITDGRIHEQPIDREVVEMRKGTQWVQIDLEANYTLAYIMLWHDDRFPQSFHDVIVQAADDPEFKANVRTLFNNDADNSSGLGAGNDAEYKETQSGKRINGKNVAARFLRFYSRGSDLGAYNVYQEIEVYGVGQTTEATERP